jgi:sugar lactone lactonase YvrE
MEVQAISVQSKPSKVFMFDHTLDRTFEDISGMVFDKDDNLILADESFLRMHNKDGKYVKQCKLGGTAWDISCHNKSGRIIVSLLADGIQFVENFVAHTKISVQKIITCYGVTWVDDNVYVGGYDRKGIGKINILDSNGQHISSISIISSISSVLFIHHRDNTIYYTDFFKVYCIKKDGSSVFTFNSPDLTDIFDIDTDRQGNIYVVGRHSNNILRLSPDGQNSHIIMKEDDGISDPRTLCFSGDFKKLFVSNEGGKQVDVYNCEY